jgi:WD40 repeat protein
VVHRDIKPANILLDAAGQPWITDFGLARLQTEATMTMTGDLLGTLRYMAPEQALGKRAAVDHRADTYSLALTLYELLALRPAFNGHDREELLQQITFEEPRGLRKIDRSIPIDLDVIVRKAASKNPSDRYDSAKDFADDLQRFLNHQPIVAKPPSTLEHAFKWAQRRPATAALVAVLIMASSLLWAVTAWHARRLSTALIESEKNRKEAEANELQALKREESLSKYQYALHIKLASDGYSTGNAAPVVDLLSRYGEGQPDAHLRGFEWFYLWNKCRSEFKTLDAHIKQINMVGYSPDNKLLVTASDDGTAKIWDGQTYKPRATLAGHSQCINEFAFAPDGRWLATASCDGTVKLWDMTSYRELATLDEFGEPVRCLAVSPDGKTVAAGVGANNTILEQSHGAITLWDVESHSRKSEPIDHGSHVKSVAFSPDGTKMVTAAGDYVRVWSTEDGSEIGRAVQFEAKCVRYSKDGSTLVSAGGIGPPTVIIWDQDSLRPKKVFRSHFGVNSVTVADDNSLVAAGTNGCSIEVWDVQTEKRQVFLNGHVNVQSVAFRPDGRQLVGGERETPATVHIWDLAREAGLKLHLKLPSHRIDGVAFDGLLTKMATRESNGKVGIWNLEAGKLAKSVGGQSTDPKISARSSYLCVSENGMYVAAPNLQGHVEVWETVSGERVALLESTHNGVSHVRFFDDDRRLIGLVADADKIRLEAVIWDVATGALQRQIELTGSLSKTVMVTSLAVHPRGDLVAISENLDLLVHSLLTGKLIANVEDSGDWKRALNFSGDGERLVYGTGGTAIVWDWNTTHFQRFVGHDGPVRAVAISPDAKTVATGDDTGVVRLWEPQSGQEMLKFEGVGMDVQLLQFSTDGKSLACWSRRAGLAGPSEVRVWSIEPPISSRHAASYEAR